jgi:hypothetical protein
MGYRFFLIFFALSITGFSQTPTEIKFVWKSAKSGSKVFEKAIMLIPVKFKSDSTTYFLQFDTGATKSSLYLNRLGNSGFSEGELETSIGNIIFTENASVQISNDQSFAVGTLGADFLKDKIVQIDFKNQVITFNQAYNEADYYWQEIKLLHGRPVVEIKLDAYEKKVLFDTGSGLFGIWTTRKYWKKFRDSSDPPSSFPITSWGKVNDGYYSNINRDFPLIIGETFLSKNLKIWYVKNKKFKRFFKRNHLFGILGNQPFLEKEILLDYQRKNFGIKKFL